MSESYEEVYSEEWSEDFNFESAEEPPKSNADYQKFVGQGSAISTARLIQELRSLDPETCAKFGYQAEIVGDNLYHWHVKLFGFPTDSKLHSDMIRQKVDHILMEITFPPDYPDSPPFLRVIRPRFAFRTGHVTIGGAICTEMLCRSGWRPVYTIEAMLMQIKSAMTDPEGEGRLDPHQQKDYTMEEAKEAFNRFAAQHGWQ